METLAGLWLPIVVSSVLVFVASSLIWNVLGAHKWHIKGLPDEAGAREALSKQALAPGMYTIPYSASPAAMKDPAFQEKLAKGPVAVHHGAQAGDAQHGRVPRRLVRLPAVRVLRRGLRLRADAAPRRAVHARLPRGGSGGVRGLLLRPDPERDLVGAPLEERAQGVRGRHRLRRS